MLKLNSIKNLQRFNLRWCWVIEWRRSVRYTRRLACTRGWWSADADGECYPIHSPSISDVLPNAHNGGGAAWRWEFCLQKHSNESINWRNVQGGPKNWYTFLYAPTLPNINRFSKLFHGQNREKIYNRPNTITKDPTTPEVCRYATFLHLWNIGCLKTSKQHLIENIDNFCSNTF